MRDTLQRQFTEREEALIDDCTAIWVENDFLSRWHRIKAYHEIGTRILEEGTSYGERTVTLVAESIGKSTRNVYRAIEFAKLFPNLDLLPEGKNTTWYQIIHRFLPEQLGGVNKETNTEFVYVCPNCNYEQSKTDIKFVKKVA